MAAAAVALLTDLAAIFQQASRQRRDLLCESGRGQVP
jgi:hypothetical protein